jgi:hypothetical protein
MTVLELLEQPCYKSDNINKVVTSCQQLVPYLLTTWGKECELADLLQDVRLLRACLVFCVWLFKMFLIITFYSGREVRKDMTEDCCEVCLQVVRKK